MNEYDVSDYGIFDKAISTNNSLKGKLDDALSVVRECKAELNDSIFMGPISDNCQEVFGTLTSDINTCISDVSHVSAYLNDTSNNYQAGDKSASSTITSNGSSSSSGTVGVSTPSVNNTSVDNTSVNYNVGVSDSSIDISKYSNNPSAGFTVTTGNTTYSLNDSDKDLLYSIVSAECDKSYDDALAVATTILNRCEAPNWVASHGTNPISQATASGQFVVYEHGSYKTYTNGNSPEVVRQAVDDALSGVRNHDYLSFRSNASTGYSNNMISSTGNRYK